MTEPKFIGVEDLQPAIHRVIEEEDETFIFSQTCEYVDGYGWPACMVGRYLINELDLSTTFFHGETNANDIGSIIRDVEEELGIVFSPDAESALIQLQKYQDTLYPWGTAYELTFGESF